MRQWVLLIASTAVAGTFLAQEPVLQVQPSMPPRVWAISSGSRTPSPAAVIRVPHATNETRSIAASSALVMLPDKTARSATPQASRRNGGNAR